MLTKNANPANGKKTKQAVIHSALKLFNMGGYDGTSIRAIATEAGVNIALVSYYFGGKQGLLEYLMASFYEGYLETLENAAQEAEKAEKSADERLVSVADALIRYQQDYFYLSRFVHREMTLDNQLVRELMSSYLMKEKFLMSRLFERIEPEIPFDPMAADFAILQYRDMIMMPFLQPQFLREVFYLKPSESSFRMNYLRYIRQWARQFASRSREHSGIPG
ncbi:TetR/AcrR family transcriptional regulator [Sporolactobacillus sp. THM7-4]|nr:TetR/AcrR family transcriptional regulator [Sporolactobacillus sp. THM7-4]